MKKNLFSIGKKQVRVPIVQGGMGVGISLGRLAGTVAKEGGAGTISAAQIGFKEPVFYFFQMSVPYFRNPFAQLLFYDVLFYLLSSAIFLLLSSLT